MNPPMTKKDLIEQLKDFPDDTPIEGYVCYDSGSDDYRDNIEIEMVIDTVEESEMKGKTVIILQMEEK